MMHKYFAALLIGIALIPACAQKSREGIAAAGVVDGDIITIKALVTGRLMKLTLREGTEVKKGDVLAEINTDKLLNQREGLDINEKDIKIKRTTVARKISWLETNLSYWKEQVQRFERLRQKESISGDELEKAKLKLKEVETSLFEAKQTLNSISVQLENINNQRQRIGLLLEDHVITSPISGIVLEKFLSEGEFVFPGTPVADILDQGSLFIETFLEEQEMSRLQLGQKVNIMNDGFAERVFSGSISAFGQKAEFSPRYILSEKERRSLLYQVKIRIDENRQLFKIGMPVTIHIDE